MSATQAPIAFLFDVDNTLLDNDRVRHERDYVDFPHTRERFTRTFPDEPGLPALADAVLSYPNRLITLHVCQGRYAHAAEHEPSRPRIGPSLRSPTSPTLA